MFDCVTRPLLRTPRPPLDAGRRLINKQLCCHLNADDCAPKGELRVTDIQMSRR